MPEFLYLFDMMSLQVGVETLLVFGVDNAVDSLDLGFEIIVKHTENLFTLFISCDINLNLVGFGLLGVVRYRSFHSKNKAFLSVNNYGKVELRFCKQTVERPHLSGRHGNQLKQNFIKAVYIVLLTKSVVDISESDLLKVVERSENTLRLKRDLEKIDKVF